MAVLGYLDIILGAKTEKLDSGLNAGKAKVSGFRSELKGAFDNTSLGGSLGGLAKMGPAGIAAGAAVAGGLAVLTAAGAAAAITIRGVNDQLEQIDTIGDAAKRLGMQFNELVTLRLSLGRSSGLDEGTIDASLQKMQLNLAKAREGSGELHDTLESLGLDAGKLLEAGPVDAMKQISEAAQGMKDPVDQSKLAFELFGKSGVGLVTSFRDGPGAIAEMEERAKQLGLTLSQAQVEQVGAANDAWDDMGLIATGVFRQLAAEAAPVVTVIAETVSEIATSFGGWQTALPTIVDNTAYFAGVMYDVWELTDLTRSTLVNIATLNFDAIGENFKNAMDFTTGEKWVNKIQDARDKAAEEAAKAKLPAPDGDALEAAASAKAAQPAGDPVADRMQAMREEIDLIGKTREEVDRLKFARMGASAEQLKDFDALQKSKLQAEEMAKAAERGKEITAQMQTPLEKLKLELEELTDLNGAINDETFQRAEKDIAERGFKLLELETPKIGMLQKGSVEAWRQGNANERAGKEPKTLEDIKRILERIANSEPSKLKKV